MKAVVIYLYAIALLCGTLAVAAGMLGAWWNIQGIYPEEAYESAFVMAVCGGIAGFIASGISISLTK